MYAKRFRLPRDMCVSVCGHALCLRSYVERGDFWYRDKLDPRAIGFWLIQTLSPLRRLSTVLHDPLARPSTQAKDPQDVC